MPKVSVFAAIFDIEGRILLVKRNYGNRRWTTPGGGMEAGESPIEGVRREVFEEINGDIEIGPMVGVYSTPALDDLVILFEAKLCKQGKWQPNNELSHVGYFDRSKLPEPLHERTRTRILDAFDQRRGVIRVFGNN